MQFNMNETQKEVLRQVRLVYDYIVNKKKFVALIPEVRTNVSISLPNAQSSTDIAAIDGRITVVNDMPKACGDIKFGASDHTARLLLTVKKFDSRLNCVINLKYIPELIKKLESKSNLTIVSIDRTKEPDNKKEKEQSTMQWLIQKVVEERGNIPDIVWDEGAMGKEPMIRLFAKSGEELKEKIKKIITIMNQF